MPEYCVSHASDTYPIVRLHGCKAFMQTYQSPVVLLWAAASRGYETTRHATDILGVGTAMKVAHPLQVGMKPNGDDEHDEHNGDENVSGSTMFDVSDNDDRITTEMIQTFRDLYTYDTILVFVAVIRLERERDLLFQATSANGAADGNEGATADKDPDTDRGSDSAPSGRRATDTALAADDEEHVITTKMVEWVFDGFTGGRGTLSTVYRRLKALAKHGLVEKRPIETDATSAHHTYVLTARGRDVAKRKGWLQAEPHYEEVGIEHRRTRWGIQEFVK